jgi:hypothetical protein
MRAHVRCTQISLVWVEDWRVRRIDTSTRVPNFPFQVILAACVHGVVLWLGASGAGRVFVLFGLFWLRFVGNWCKHGPGCGALTGLPRALPGVAASRYPERICRELDTPSRHWRRACLLPLLFPSRIRVSVWRLKQRSRRLRVRRCDSPRCHRARQLGARQRVLRVRGCEINGRPRDTSGTQEPALSQLHSPRRSVGQSARSLKP